MSITIRQIARDLKLAVSTVSKALSDSYEISAHTKRLVLDYAARHNYVPNAYAGSLKHRRTRNIAVVLPEVADTFFSNAINGIERVAKTKGYHVIVYLTHESFEQEESILQELRGGRVDGVLISVSGGVASDSLVHMQLAKKIPLVFFDRVCEAVDASQVLTDDYESAHKATQHLIARGCRKPVFVAPTEALSIISKRYDGFANALQEAGYSCDDSNYIRCSNDENLCHDVLAAELLASKADGLVCSVEKLAMTAYLVCRENQLKIPEDIRIIAFSNLQIASLLAPSLSTVEQPAFEMGETAATLLFKALKNKDNIKAERVVVPSVIHVRESTG